MYFITFYSISVTTIRKLLSFLEKISNSRKNQKKKFSRQNQIEIFTYYYKLKPLKFFFLCVTGTLLYVMDISVFVFNQKNQKLKKNGHFCFSFCVKIKKLKQEIKSQSISHIYILLFLSSFLMLQPIICCNTSLYLLIITITKKEFRIKYCEPFEKTTTPIIKYLITTAAF